MGLAVHGLIHKRGL